MAIVGANAAVTRAGSGSALVETALTVGVALLVIFNALQLSLLGFYQLHADAAAFVGARVAAITGSNARAATAVGADLPLTLDSLVLSTAGGASQAVVAKTAPGLLLVPGAPSSVVVHGMDQEPIPPPGSTDAHLQFVADPARNFLLNYYPPGVVGAPAAAMTKHALYIAQTITSGGNGSNGRFGEWRDHQACFAGLSYGSYAGTQTGIAANGQYAGPTAAWINYTGNANQAVLYGWDAGNIGVAC